LERISLENKEYTTEEICFTIGRTITSDGSLMEGNNDAYNVERQTLFRNSAE